jgi:phosphate starvation-inducible PhoH-like protein
MGRLKKTISSENETECVLDAIKTKYNGKSKAMSPEYKPRGENQEKYVSYLQDPNIQMVLGVGPAGCGKTLFACHSAIQQLKQGKIEKIIMTRPLISVDKEDIGYLPGNLANKMDPWTRPIFDILQEFFTKRDIDSMVNSGVIEISPLAYMRGRTFKNAFVIADEMQNSSPNQMLMTTTRIGKGSKLIITGDVKQSDRTDSENGLLDLITKIKEYKSHTMSETIPGIRLVQLNETDIERSPLVSTILQVYEPKKTKPVHYEPPKKIYKTEIYGSDCAIIPKHLYERRNEL